MTTITGPAWSAPGLDIAGGRYPLAVERHVMRMVDLLVPGVTAVTPHARYYTLHGLIAAEAASRDLTDPEARDLLRRAEVALAVISAGHAHSQRGLPRAHGADALAGQIEAGSVEVASASQPGPGGYVRNTWGFWPPYLGSELRLGIIAAGTGPTPGPEIDDDVAAVLRAGFDGLLDLAARPTLSPTLAADHAHLCVCAGGGRPDGQWLARLLCGTPDTPPRTPAGTRRATIRLLARTITTHPIRHVTADVGPALAFGPYASTDPVAAAIAVTDAWRGVALRNYAVGAWRRLWSWLVENVAGQITAAELADTFAEQLPDVTVARFRAELPDTMGPDRDPLPAEAELRRSDRPLPERELAVLATNARRIDELTGHVRDAFLGDHRGVDLAPEWVARRLDANNAVALPDFARDLTFDLLARAHRVALTKARRRPDGTLWLPARLHQRGDTLFKTSEEGRGDVGLRLDQLTTVLAGAGTLTLTDAADGASGEATEPDAADDNERWQLTDLGAQLLELPT
jgi:hypothetical protein